MNEDLQLTLITNDSAGAFELYCREIGELFCPYLLPSIRSNCCYYATIDLRHLKPKAVRAYVYTTSVQYSSIFLNMRDELNEKEKQLLCINVVYELPEYMKGSERSCLDWPHWMLKTEFSKHGVMFGKFWKHEQTNSRDGRVINIPSHNFISIRTFFPGKDVNLLSRKYQYEVVSDLVNTTSQKNVSVNNEKKNNYIGNPSEEERIKNYMFSKSRAGRKIESNRDREPL